MAPTKKELSNPATTQITMVTAPPPNTPSPFLSCSMTSSILPSKDICTLVKCKPHLRQYFGSLRFSVLHRGQNIYALRLLFYDTGSNLQRFPSKHKEHNFYDGRTPIHPRRPTGDNINHH